MDASDWDNLGAAFKAMKEECEDLEIARKQAVRDGDNILAQMLYARISGITAALVTVSGYMGVKLSDKAREATI